MNNQKVINGKPIAGKASQGDPMNASYCGRHELPVLQEALVALQTEHLLLRSTLLWEGDPPRFAPAAAAVPVALLPWPGDGRSGGRRPSLEAGGR